jgi:uncharacterized protein YcbX
MHIGHIKEIWRYPVKSLGGEIIKEATLDDFGMIGDRCWSLINTLSADVAWGKSYPRLMNLEARFVSDHPPVRVYADAVPPVTIRFPDGDSVLSSDDVAAKISEYAGASVDLRPLESPENRDHYRWQDPLDEQKIMAILGVKPGERVPDLSAYDEDLIQLLGEYYAPPGTYNDMFPVHLLTSASVEHMEKISGEDFDRRRFRPSFYVETAAGVDGLAEFAWVGKYLAVGEAVLSVGAKTIRCSMPARAQAPHQLEQNPAIAKALYQTTDRFFGIYLSVVTHGKVREGDEVTLQDSPEL